MKKFLSMLFAIMLLASVSITPAMADGDTTPYKFGFTASCTEGASLNHSTNYQKKIGDCTIIEVRHSVIGNGSDAGYTNYMYGYVEQDDTYYGAKWHAPDMIFHSCTSNLLWANDRVAPGGRGNTKYNENLGLTSIRIEGQFRPH